MKNKIYSCLLLFPLAAVLILQLNSCNAPKPAKCVITVRDSSGTKLLFGVKVELYAMVNNSKADLKVEGLTGSDGKVSFTFKNPCVMDVLATKQNCTVNASASVYCQGSGIVKCEEGKTAEKTIRIDR